jgi:pyridoxine kinase
MQNLQKRVLTIQDISAVGRCSITVALPIISAAGIECSVLPTAVLSTHTGGFEGYTYRDLTSDITPIAEHWKTLGLKFDALYTGYLGSFEQIDLVSGIFDDFKAPDGVVIIDPVMADNGVLYGGFSDDFPAAMAKLSAKADVILPNLTEAAFLLGEEYNTAPDKDYVEGLLKRLRGLGAPNVVLTGVSFEAGKLGVATYNDSGTGYFFREKIDGYYHGTGDVFASAFLAKYLSKRDLLESAGFAADFTVSCIIEKQKIPGEARYGVPFERCLGQLAGIV